MGQSPVETEIKLAVADLRRVRDRLRDAGFVEVKPRVFEANDLYDTPGELLWSAGEILRVRAAGETGALTFKAKGSASKHKSRVEIETTLGNPAAMANILERCGFRKSFRYEKFRTECRRNGEPGVVVVDETPIGNFLELEGPPEWIDTTAAELGFHESDYITQSYGTLYIESCERSGKPLGNMVFEDPAVE